jgi:hypothetical protein
VPVPSITNLLYRADVGLEGNFPEEGSDVETFGGTSTTPRSTSESSDFDSDSSSTDSRAEAAARDSDAETSETESDSFLQTEDEQLESGASGEQEAVVRTS